MNARFAWPVLLCSLAGCQVGTKVENFPPARSPEGAFVQLKLRRGAPGIGGELLAVQDTALLVRRGPVIELVLLASVRSGKAIASGSRASFGGRLNPRTRQRLRLLSRYPQGVTPELLRKLLDAYGQAEVKVTAP